ncbi:hypothetical protein JX266_008058 [Neoarthrinium moseri]|nr:hypothetical protein JX266_008058 [Neoarthrinium moseri]
MAFAGPVDVTGEVAVVSRDGHKALTQAGCTDIHVVWAPGTVHLGATCNDGNVLTALDLNACYINKDAALIPQSNGGGFSSCHSCELQEDNKKLKCACGADSATFWYTTVNLDDTVFVNANGRLGCWDHEGVGGTPFSKGCSGVELAGTSIQGYCKAGSLYCTTLDLPACIGNNDGSLNPWDGGGFDKNCERCHLVDGFKYHCQCWNIDHTSKWETEVDLNQVIYASDSGAISCFNTIGEPLNCWGM